MATEILMPALSPTMEEGTLAKWLVKEGDMVKSGQIIAEIETDKARWSSRRSMRGYVGKILVAEGTAGVKVNTPIAVLVEAGESVPAPAPVAAQPWLRPPLPVAPPLPGGARCLPRQWRTSKALGRLARRHADEDHDGARSPARGDGRRDAREPQRLSDGRGGRRISGRLQDFSQGLLDEFGPKRVIDTPITEHGFAGHCGGIGLWRLNPIVEFMTFNFAMQAIDHIINSAAKTLYMSGGQMGCSIVFRGPNGAAARVGAQHSQDYAAWYAAIPGLKVVMPYSAADAKGLLKSAIRDPNPVIFLENEILYGRSFEVPDLPDFTIPFGKARIWREGSDVTIVSFGIGMTYALDAAEQLAKDGISAEVIDLRTLRPIDYDTVLASGDEDQPLRDGRRGLPGRLDRQPYRGSTIMQTGLRPSGCAGGQLHGQGCADALCGQP